MRPIAEKKLRHYIADIWLNEQKSDINKIIGLVDALKDNKAVNEDFLKLLREKMDLETAALRLEILSAEIAENWSLLLDKTNMFILEAETDSSKHNALWYKGLALYKLGREKEALEVLKIYVKYAKNEFEYPKAEKLISELEAK